MRSTVRTADEPSAEAVGEQARQFLAGLAGALGSSAAVHVNVDGDDIDLKVDGDDLGLLIGPRGATLLAVQDLTRVASQRRLGDHSTHLRIDIAGYRERRREALSGSPPTWLARSSRAVWPERSSRCRRPTARSSTTR